MKKRLISTLALLLALLLLGQPALLVEAASDDADSPAALPTEPSEPAPTEPEPIETEPVETEPVETEPPQPEYPAYVDHPVYIHGDNSGAFLPGKSLSRAELAQILYNVLAPDAPAADAFPDVEEGAWYAPAVNTLAQQGLLEGYPDGTFRPGRAVTRAELVTAMARMAAEEGREDDITFSDVPQTHWARPVIALAQAKGWVDGYPDGTFRPDRAVTRAEAVTLLNRVWGRIPDRAAIDADPGLRFFPDVLPDQWFYYDVMEAATAHTARFDEAQVPEQWQEPVCESAGLTDGFRCVEGRLYLVQEGDFVRTAGTGEAGELRFTCEGKSGVCTAEASTLLLYDGTLILLTAEGRPMYPLGSYPTGFYRHDGSIYAAKDGLLVQKAGSDRLSGCRFTCEGPNGHCTVEGHTLPTVSGDWYRLQQGQVDLTPGLYSYTAGMYYVREDGTLLTNGTFNGLSFGSDAKYTSGNSRIDAEIERIIGQVTNGEMRQEEKLFACYSYVFSIALNYRAYTHVPKGQDCSVWAEPYMLRFLDWNGKGNCYCFASLYYYLCRRIGYWQAKAVSGAVFSKGYDHGWVEITIDGTRYLFDPRTDARNNKAPGALYRKTYDGAPYVYYPPD